MSNKTKRRSFIRQIGLGLPAVAATGRLQAENVAVSELIERPKRPAANDRVQIACIGMGIMGFGDCKAALKTDGVELVGVADCYQGRLTRAREVFGKDLRITRDYRELINDPSIDAVIIAAPDHWHQQMSLEALAKGKAVYCEKPMVQKVEQGAAVLEAQKKAGKAFQVGSQFVSSIVYLKARELYLQGAIGELNFAEAYFDRFSALGAWQYSIPPDASPQTMDWDMFVGPAPKRPFDATRFFRWRNYRDYGTGIPGDLFVHLLSMLHMITGSSGPEKIYATGGLRYWKDGRDVPDVTLALFDYPKTDQHPAFNFAMRVNFVDGSGGKEGIRMVGSEGEMQLGWTTLTIKKKKLPVAPGYGGWDSFGTFPEATQAAFEKAYQAQYGHLRSEMQEPGELIYAAPTSYGAEGSRYDHFNNWFNAIRNGAPIIEDAAFGLRAAGPAIASLVSQTEGRIIRWDPVQMKMT